MPLVRISLNKQYNGWSNTQHGEGGARVCSEATAGCRPHQSIRWNRAKSMWSRTLFHAIFACVFAALSGTVNGWTSGVRAFRSPVLRHASPDALVARARIGRTLALNHRVFSLPLGRKDPRLPRATSIDTTCAAQPLEPRTALFSSPPAVLPRTRPPIGLREGLENCLLSLAVISSLVFGNAACAEEQTNIQTGSLFATPVSHLGEGRHLSGVGGFREAAGIEQGWTLRTSSPDGNVLFLATAEGKSGQAQGGTVEAGKDGAVDAEHKLMNEVLQLVDEHFLDLNNKDGVVDSAKKHMYNGINWDQVRKEISGKDFKDKKQTYKEIEKVLSRLGDKYTRFLSPSEFQKLSKYDVTGVGLLLIQKGGSLYVAAPPLAGSTSAEAGVQKGDRLITIEGQDVQNGKTPFEGSELLSGKAGTSAEVVLERVTDGVTKETAVSLKRTITVENPVTTYVVTAKDGCKVGYMRMKEFNAACKRSIAEAVQELKEEGVDSYVLDLRGNPGGVLEGSLEIAGLFMTDELGASKRTLVYVMDRNGKQEPIWAQPRLTIDTKTPMLVLVDKKSASASEVLTGSLHDNCRAVVVGKEHSYGKGLIQGAFPLSDGSGVVLTVAKYLTPKLAEINGIGVIPDIETSVGDARAAIKSGKLDIKKVLSVLPLCEEPRDVGERSGDRSGTDNTLQMLNGDGNGEKKKLADEDDSLGYASLERLELDKSRHDHTLSCDQVTEYM